MNRLSDMERMKIVMLRCCGKSVNDISRQTGHSKITILGVMKEVANKIDGREPPPTTKPPKPMQCDNCIVRPVNVNSEFYRATRRTRHKFCSVTCYGEFISKKRADDRCARCDILRGDLKCPTFSRGYCQKCYQLLRQYGFDFEIAEVHDLTQTLKKESHNVTDRKHVRPSQDTR